MSIYALQEAELNGIEGQGYAYPVKTFRGKEYRGVFFADDEDAVQEAQAEDEVQFTGTIYDATRERVETFPVNVTDTVAVGIGERATFEAVEQP